MKPAPTPRPGRPPRAQAAEVEDRILAAAERVFLKRGFEGASMDEVAEAAHAGKTTIYARYAGKQALFAAVVLRNVSHMLESVEVSPHGATLEARLRALGAAIVQRATQHKTIDLFRVTLSEAERFPDIAHPVSLLARERGVGEVARLLGELYGAGEPQSAPADPALLCASARIFMDLVALPLIMRRLFGESAAALEAEIPGHVAERVAFFLAGSRPRNPASVEA